MCIPSISSQSASVQSHTLRNFHGKSIFHSINTKKTRRTISRIEPHGQVSMRVCLFISNVLDHHHCLPPKNFMCKERLMGSWNPTISQSSFPLNSPIYSLISHTTRETKTPEKGQSDKLRFYGCPTWKRHTKYCLNY